MKNKESTYIHDYTKKEASRFRARTQLPKRKGGHLGDTTYHQDYEGYKIDAANANPQYGNELFYFSMCVFINC